MYRNILTSFILLISIVGFARAEGDIDSEIKKEFIKIDEINFYSFNADDNSCSVRCFASIEMDGVTYTVETSAGWLLSGCARAAERCREKLNELGFATEDVRVVW